MGLSSMSVNPLAQLEEAVQLNLMTEQHLVCTGIWPSSLLTTTQTQTHPNLTHCLTCAGRVSNGISPAERHRQALGLTARPPLLVKLHISHLTP